MALLFPSSSAVGCALLPHRRLVSNVVVCVAVASLFLNAGASHAASTTWSGYVRDLDDETGVTSTPGRRIPDAAAGMDASQWACSEERIAACYEPLTSAFQSVSSDAVIVPHFDNETLDLLCRRLTVAKSCLNSVDHELNDTCRFGNSIRQGQELAVEFICGAGNSVYHSHHECLLSPTVQRNGIECYATFRSRLELAAGSGYSKTLQENKLALCRYIDELVTCITDVTNASCGDVAARWMLAFKTLLTRPAKRQIGEPSPVVVRRQPLTDVGFNRTPVLFYVVAVCLVAAAALSLTLFLSTRRKRHGRPTVGSNYVFAGTVRRPQGVARCRPKPVPQDFVVVCSGGAAGSRRDNWEVAAERDRRPDDAVAGADRTRSRKSSSSSVPVPPPERLALLSSSLGPANSPTSPGTDEVERTNVGTTTTTTTTSSSSTSCRQSDVQPRTGMTSFDDV